MNGAGAVSPSLMRLQAYADELRSGEVIFAGADTEIHVYLQEGRIAWATSATARYAFTRHLLEGCNIDKTSMRDVIAECQKTKKPLGETLVAWKLCSEDQVRMALHAQVIAALSELIQEAKTQDIFLDRGEAYREYDAFFTFDLKNLAKELTPAESAPPPSRKAPAPFESPVEIVKHLVRERGEDIFWAAVVRELDIIAADSDSGVEPSVELIERLAPFASVEDASLTVVREACCGMVCVPLPKYEATLWCALRAEPNLAAMIRHLDNIAGSPEPEPVIRPEGKNTWQAIVNPDFVVASRTAEDAIEQTPELRAAFLARKPGGDPSLIRRHDEPFDPALTLSARLVKQLDKMRDPVVDGAPERVGLERAGSMQLWIRTPDRIHCATVEQQAPRFNLWLVFDPDTSIGFTEAILSTLSRQMAIAFSRERWPDESKSA